MGARQAGPGKRIFRIDLQCSFVALDAAQCALPRQMIAEELPLQVQAVGLRIVAAAHGCGLDVGFGARQRTVGGGCAKQRGAQFFYDRFCDIVLHREDVIELAFVGLRPQA